MNIKKIVLIVSIVPLILTAKVELKEGNYSCLNGANQSFLSIKKNKNNKYSITGTTYHGVGWKYGPSIGEVDFTDYIKRGKMFHIEKIHITEFREDDEEYKFNLKVNKNGSFDVKDDGYFPFGRGASFEGHYTSVTLPSFSCARAKSFIEHTICKNKELARLDRKLKEIYDVLMSAYDYDDNTLIYEKKLKKEQNNWIKKRNSCKNNKDYKKCLINSYSKRIKSLKEKFNNFWNYD